MLNPIPKLLAGLLAVTVMVALWYRSEAAVATAEASSWRAATEQLSKNAAATEKAISHRRIAADRRKEQHETERTQDRVALDTNQDWATQPIPAGILERLRPSAVGAPKSSTGSTDNPHN